MQWKKIISRDYSSFSYIRSNYFPIFVVPGQGNFAELLALLSLEKVCQQVDQSTVNALLKSSERKKGASHSVDNVVCCGARHSTTSGAAGDNLVVSQGKQRGMTWCEPWWPWWRARSSISSRPSASQRNHLYSGRTCLKPSRTRSSSLSNVQNQWCTCLLDAYNILRVPHRRRSAALPIHQGSDTALCKNALPERRAAAFPQGIQ